MITDAYNRNNTNAETLFTDNGVLVEQGVLSKKTIVAANKNHSVPSTRPAHAPAQPAANNAPTTSFSKSMKPDSDNNPISNEMVSDGLGALFGAATGLDWIEMALDYACDAIEFRDEYVNDRGQRFTPPAPQPDPRLWLQMPMPVPGYAVAA